MFGAKCSLQIFLCFILFISLPGSGYAQTGSNSTIAKELAALIGLDEVYPFPLNGGDIVRRITRKLGVENDVSDNVADLVNMCGSAAYRPVTLLCEATAPVLVEGLYACFWLGDSACTTASDVVCAVGEVVSGASAVAVEVGDFVCCAVSSNFACPIGEVGYVGPSFPSFPSTGEPGPSTPTGPAEPSEEPGGAFPTINEERVIVLQ